MYQDYSQPGYFFSRLSVRLNIRPSEKMDKSQMDILGEGDMPDALSSRP